MLCNSTPCFAFIGWYLVYPFSLQYTSRLPQTKLPEISATRHNIRGDGRRRHYYRRIQTLSSRHSGASSVCANESIHGSTRLCFQTFVGSSGFERADHRLFHCIPEVKLQRFPAYPAALFSESNFLFVSLESADADGALTRVCDR